MLSELAVWGRSGDQSYLALRNGEALALKREDMSMNWDIPKIRVTGETTGGKKLPGDVYVRKGDVEWWHSLLQKGYTVERTKRPQTLIAVFKASVF